MKNIPIAVAFIASIGCTYILLSNTNKQDISDFQSNAVGIQIGVFKNFNNAESLRKRLGGYIIKDKDVYRIYYGILKMNDNISFVTNYLKNQGISYYITEMLLKDETLKVLNVYEEKVYNEKKDELKIKMIFDFMKNYEEVI